MRIIPPLSNVLVIQTAFIGDAILATSVIEKIHQFYPTSNIYFLIRKGNESLFSGHPFLKEVWTIDKKKKYKSYFDVLLKIRQKKFDLLINLHRYFSTNLIALLSGARLKAGYHKLPFNFFFTSSKKHSIGDGRHETERNHTLIAFITDSKPARPKLYPAQTDFQFVDTLKSVKYICLFPASLWQTKQWPIQKWVELCNRVQNFKIYLLGGENDVKVCSEIMKSSIRSEEHTSELQSH